MTKLTKSVIFRPLLAFLLALVGVLFQPKHARADGSCGSTCLYYCPGNPWSYCRTVFGGGSGDPSCGMLASCSYGGDCGMLTLLTCYTSFPE